MASVPKHTPEPWFIQQEQNPTTPSSGRTETLAVHDAHGERVALVTDLDDAHLIAAAPELYEAARLLIDTAEERVTGVNSVALNMLIAALAKAEGRS